MACPLFIPSTPLGEIIAIAPPLGDLFRGSCSADPTAEIATDFLRRCCNFGYARGECARAESSNADAARFVVKSESAGPDGTRIVRIAWALERDHHPVAVGTLDIDISGTETGVLALQAQACAASYLRQTAHT